MSTIWEITEAALDDLGVAMAANVYNTASGTQLPDQFMVYFLVSSPPELHADDYEELRSYRMQVSIYDRAGLINLPDVDSAMVTAGFTRGPKRELPYNPDTKHFGIAQEYVYLEEQAVQYPGFSA